MRLGNELVDIPPYEDHVGLWKNELKLWAPDTIFDAHVHLGPPEAVGAFGQERLREPLCTFAGMTLEELETIYSRLFSGKCVAGLIAFPWPVREVNFEAANAYIVGLMKRAPKVKGFLLAHPTDVARTRADFERAHDHGVRFSGVKPYFDFLGKSNYEVTMPEFIPEALLDFMNAEELIMMLHTSGQGMGAPENQEYVHRVLGRYPRIRIIMAHMGRYLRVEDFFGFCDSGLFEYPSLYLEMSSATRTQVYARALENPATHERLLFGTDLPYGMIAGVEAWSEKTGPVFVSRHRCVSSDEGVNDLFAHDTGRLTYNTYHVIDAFKDALDSVVTDAASAEVLKKKVFHDNAASLFNMG